METAVETPADPAAPVPLEAGRYKVFSQDNGFVIARAVNTCERCAGCGCGDQQEPLDISPAGVAKLMSQARAAGLVRLPFGLGRPK
jgi:hypothetical protein